MATGPIFVTADEPLIVFESLDRALAYLEWPDVEDGLFLGYDSDGRLIQFGTEAIPKRRFTIFRERRVVADVEPDPTHAEELRRTLARVLALPETTPFEELRATAVSWFGLT
jgi:hypothetical protein